jgi:hypothetical protein
MTSPKKPKKTKKADKPKKTTQTAKLDPKSEAARVLRGFTRKTLRITLGDAVRAAQLIQKHKKEGLSMAEIFRVGVKHLTDPPNHHHYYVENLEKQRDSRALVRAQNEDEAVSLFCPQSQSYEVTWAMPYGPAAVLWVGDNKKPGSDFHPGPGEGLSYKVPDLTLSSKPEIA